jgi:hypothetical protein
MNMTDLTPEHAETLRIFDPVIEREMTEIKARGGRVPAGYHRARLTVLCPEAAAAADRFFKGRKAAAKRIDPLTCEWAGTSRDVVDPYGIWASRYCIGRSFVVWDDRSDGDVHSSDLSDEQREVLRERIKREGIERDGLF